MSLNISIKTQLDSLNSKTIVITGTTNGIGQETLKLLAQSGANIVVGVRNTNKAELQKQELLKLHPNLQITIFKLDLSDESSIKNFSNKLNFLCQAGIDVLINNAGVYGGAKEILPNGFEKHFFINCIAPMLLTKLALPLLKTNENSKVVFLSSLSQKFTKFDFEDFDFKKQNKTMKLYANSKKWLTYSALKLKDELAQTNVCVNLVHPGVVSTSLFNNSKIKIFKPIMQIIFPSSKRACLCEIAGATQKTNGLEWITPSVFGIWGKPKSKKFKLKKEDYKKLDLCFQKINEICSGITKM